VQLAESTRPSRLSLIEAYAPLVRTVDECDCGCSLPALVRVTLRSGGVLLFCGDCFEHHEAGVTPHAAYIYSERTPQPRSA
jgi:hypothetical protein